MNELQKGRADADAAWAYVEDVLNQSDFFSDEREACVAVLSSRRLLQTQTRALVDFLKVAATATESAQLFDMMHQAPMLIVDAARALDANATLATTLCSKWNVLP